MRSLALLRECTEGETWTWHPQSGVVIAHPERPPVWCRYEAGKVVETVIEVAAYRVCEKHGNKGCTHSYCIGEY